MGNDQTNARYGLRITKIQENSPASSLSLSPYFDYIIDILNKPPNFNLSSDFYKYIIENEEKEVKLVIYSQITKIRRLVLMTPSRNWPNSDFLLGFKVRYENITKAEENMYRITALKNPKLKGSIFPIQDFFVAIEEIIFDDLEDLKSKLASHKRCEVVLYNLEDDEVRTVGIECGSGHGFGFEIATGVLHDLPSILNEKQIELGKKGIKQMTEDYASSESEQIKQNDVENEVELKQNPKIENNGNDNLNANNTPENENEENKVDNNLNDKKPENSDLEEEIQIEMN